MNLKLSVHTDKLSWLGFGILILIYIWSLVFDTPMFQILSLYLYFEGAKNIHVLYVLFWGFGGHWRVLTWVWHLDLDLYMVTDFWHMRSLEAPDFGLETSSWSRYWYRQWYLMPPWSKFWLSILILKVQSTSMSFKCWFGALENAGCSWLGLGILILNLIWQLVFDAPMFRVLALYLDFEGAKNTSVL